MFCSACGTPIPGGSGFCPTCGKPVGKQTPPKRTTRQIYGVQPNQPPMGNQPPTGGQPPIGGQPPMGGHPPIGGQPAKSAKKPKKAKAPKTPRPKKSGGQGGAPNPGKKSKKITVAVVAVVLVAAIVSSCFIFFAPKKKNSLYNSAGAFLSDSGVELKNNVRVPENPSDMEKDYEEVIINEDRSYCVCYSKRLPDFYNGLKAGEIFCVPPDESSKTDLFKSGFCGKLVSVETEGKNYFVTFTVPTVSEVIKNLKLNTETGSASSVSFIPADGVSVGGAHSLSMTALNTYDLGDISDSMKGNFFSYEENDKQSLLPGYQIIAKTIKLGLSHKLDEHITVSGDITLKYPSVKMNLDYETNEKNGELVVKQCDFDFISKEDFNMKFSAKASKSLFKVKDTSPISKVVNVIDVSEADKDKYVLGTFLIGYSLPYTGGVLGNAYNKLNYLSIGIAIQLTVTAKGEISMSVNYEQSGFVQTGCSTDGKSHYVVKGPDYPHPVIDPTPPDGSETQEKIRATSYYKGEVKLSAGASIDVGPCLLGMVPLKLTTGILGTYQMPFTNKEIKIMENSYIKDRNVQYVKADFYSKLRFNLGLNVAKAKIFNASATTDVFNYNILQLPEPIEFTTKECNFCGIQLGQSYTDDEIKDAMRKYVDESRDYNLVDYSKDMTVGETISDTLNAFGLDGTDAFESLGIEVDVSRVVYCPSGILFLRNSENTVVGIITKDKKICNKAGLNAAMSADDIMKIYSNPAEHYAEKLEIGEVLGVIFGKKLDDISAEKLYYKSKKDTAEMIIMSANDLNVLICTYK